ncbi:hypothetical protein SHJG_p1049 (plasmid) [Streptomyces hygroscopicus subsp. jinggangensis 5008]|nr:hypothetical protein SHJG_p1049 [Streptomyces hygroscopicus subsp. jinggangensis 5008]AGF68334.1 hypothetical protein SHJGH_p1049 [Streptomyces hygroscopicus subsp. jinggangensis TL01]
MPMGAGPVGQLGHLPLRPRYEPAIQDPRFLRPGGQESRHKLARDICHGKHGTGRVHRRSELARRPEAVTTSLQIRRR